MADHKHLLLLTLALTLLLSHGSLADEGNRQRSEERRRESARSREDVCQMKRMNALEPSVRLESEAGFTEFFDQNDEQFRCAGVVASRHNIEPNGLSLPSYSSSPRIAYVIQGSGTCGIVIPGCPETFQSLQLGGQSSRPIETESRRRQQQQSGDEHQRVERLRRGDVIVIPAGVAAWFHNDGNEPFVAICVTDTSNYNNQLDDTNRMFFLAGTQAREGSQGRRGERRTSTERRGSRSAEEYQTGHNIFRGFDTRIISESFGISEKTARKLQGKGEEERRRGHIIRVEGKLQLSSPRRQTQRELESEEEEEERSRRRRRSISPRTSESEEEERRERRGLSPRRRNGVEETLCNFKFRANMDSSESVDIYSSQGGQLSTLTSSKLPILHYLELSAERGRLNRNAILAPHWNINAHSIVYATRGNARIQIIDSSGRAVFDDQLREGQMIVVPQNFVVVKQARDEEFEWVSFKTNDYALTSPLVGKNSVINGIPEDVLVNSYRISPEEARRLKNERKEETMVLNPGSRGSSRM